MRKNSVSKRLLSLLLCMTMFMSLGFTAYAQPNGEEQRQILPVEDSTREQGVILPAETEAEQEPVPPAETEAEEQEPSFTLEADPLIIEQSGTASVTVTVRPTAGTVSGYTLEGEYVENMQATKLRMYYFNGLDGVLTDTNGNTMPFYVLDGGRPAETVQLGQDFEIGTSLAFGFSAQIYVFQSDWEEAKAGLYKGELLFRGCWIGEVNGVEKEVIGPYDAVAIAAMVLKEDVAYNVILNQSEGGTLSADKATALHGETVTITAAPEAGYTLQELRVTDWRDREVAVQQTGDNWSFTMPLSPVNVNAVWHASWPVLQQKIDAAENDSTIQLKQDFTAGEEDSALVIPAGKTLTIDLNGHTIDRNLKEAAANGNVITNNGTLTIRDSGEDGTIKGAFNTDSGGAVYNAGTLTVEGGVFTANTAKEAGAVYNADRAAFTFTDGELWKNTATTYGGGAVVNYGTMTMSGGIIAYNTAPMNGGGIWTAGTLTMTDGAVYANTADKGFGIYFKEGIFNISGEPQVYGNQVGTVYSDVYLLSGNRLTVTGPLADHAILSVRAESDSLPVIITSGLSGNLPGEVDDIFASDDEDLRCQLNEDGELILVDALYAIRIDPDMQGGTVTADKDRARWRDTVKLTVTPDEGMKLKEIQYLCDGDTYYSSPNEDEDGGYSFTMPPYDLTVYATFVPDVEEYPLLVGGVLVTAANKDNIFGDSGTPRATYDPETCTLTLNTTSIPLNGDTSAYIYAEGLALTVDSKRALTIDTTENGYQPIDVEYGSLTLRGEITINTEHQDGVYVYGYEDGQGNLVIDGTLTVTAINEHNPYYPVSANAIYASQNITIQQGSTVTARSESNYAISSSSGTIRILGGTSSFISTSDDALRCKYLEIQDGTVTLEGSSSDYAAAVEKDMTMSGGSLTTSTARRGLQVSGNMTISGGTVLAVGGNYGVSVGGTLRVESGIERLTGEGSWHGIQADNGIVLDPYILVQEPEGAVLNEAGTEFVLPGSDDALTRVVLVTDPAAPTFYRVTLDDSIPAGSVTADKTRAAQYETVTLTVTDLAGGELVAEYVDFKNQTVSVPDLQQVDENTWTFTMPEYDVTVSIQYKADTVYPEGKTGIQMLTLLVNGQATQEGIDEVYARAGDTITVQIRTESYYNLITAILEYQEDGETITTQVPVSYNANSGSYDASFSMPSAAATIRVTADTSRPWMALQAQINAADNGSVIALWRDITAEAGNTALVIPADKNITLDLAGFTLDRGRAEKSAAEGGNVITVNGSLTLIDSSAEKTGLVTGGNNSGSGGGIYTAGTLTIEGGTISGNVTEKWGGGVYLAQNSTLYLKGGVITQNSCVNNGAGIHISESAILNVSGDPTVWDNLKGDKTQNVNLANGALIHVIGELTGANIGVSTSTAPTESTPVRLTEGLSGKGGTENFRSDNESYCIRMVDGEAYLSRDCTVTFDPCFEGGSLETRQVPAGGSLSELPVVQREGWVFMGWFKTPAETVFDAGDSEAVTTETVFTEDTTVYAHWRQPGDVNGDGEVDNRDVTRLIRCLNYPGIEAVEANMDTNGDKKLDSEDVAQLIRFIKYQDVDLH